MFENKTTKVQGIHYSRYIASWLNSGGSIHDARTDVFREWLESNELNQDEISRVMEMMTCGKLELEYTAKQALNKA